MHLTLCVTLTIVWCGSRCGSPLEWCHTHVRTYVFTHVHLCGTTTVYSLYVHKYVDTMCCSCSNVLMQLVYMYVLLSAVL